MLTVGPYHIDVVKTPRFFKEGISNLLDYAVMELAGFVELNELYWNDVSEWVTLAEVLRFFTRSH